jgi:hypothetical protein
MGGDPADGSTLGALHNPGMARLRRIKEGLRPRQGRVQKSRAQHGPRPALFIPVLNRAHSAAVPPVGLALPR